MPMPGTADKDAGLISYDVQACGKVLDLLPPKNKCHTYCAVCQ